MKFISLLKDISLWNDFIKIYNDSFKEWERESVDRLLINMIKGRYEITIYLDNNKVQGFYILDIRTKLNYALITFLAVKKELRGKKIGSKLCLNAIDFFQTNLLCGWLLVEAGDTQARFYKNLGFERINIDYKIPKFNSKESISTQLLYINKGETINAKSLSRIIQDIFIKGYSLDEDDERIKIQLQKVNLHKN